LAKLIFTAWKAFGSVFDHFSGAKRDELRRDAERFMQIRDFVNGMTIAATDDDERRFVKISDGRSFSQEFRVRDYADVWVLVEGGDDYSWQVPGETVLLMATISGFERRGICAAISEMARRS
jgi:hypothetical protein